MAPTGRPQRVAGSVARNGPWRRAQRASSRPGHRASRRGTPPARRPAAGRRPRRDSARHPRPRSSARSRRCARAPPAGRPPAPPATPRRLARGPARPGRAPGPHTPPPTDPQPPQEVVHRVGRARRSLVGQRLQLELELGEGLGVEQLAQLLGAQQLAQQVAIERQRLRAPVEQRRVALVHVGRDVVEQQRAREGRGAARLDAHEVDLAPLDGAQDLAQRGQVEDVLEALAVGLEDDREAAVPAGHRQQLRRALAHLPERPPLGTPAPRQEQRAGRVLAEPAGEQRRAAERADDQLLDLVRRDAHRRLRCRAAIQPEQRLERAVGRSDAIAILSSHSAPGSKAAGADPRSPAGAGRCRRRTTSARPRRPASRAGGPRWPAPTARGRAPPKGDSRQIRQSPSSSRKRCRTIVRSVGRLPVAWRSSSR